MNYDKKHLRFIRKLACCACLQHPSDASHIRTGTGGGIGIKPSDCHTIPLCRACHQEQHRIGEKAFFKDMDKIHKLAGKLWEHSGDYQMATEFLTGYFLGGNK